jgi:HME family heavy-metal exporter
LTVTPVLSFWLLPGAKLMDHDKDGLLLRMLKTLAGWAIRTSIRYPAPILVTVAAAVAVSIGVVTQLGRDFLPPFNEGCVQVNVLLPPGTSLETSNAIASMVDEKIGSIRGVATFSRRTGRAELDEHAEGVNASEIIVSFDPRAGRDREARDHDGEQEPGGPVGRRGPSPRHHGAFRRSHPGPHFRATRSLAQTSRTRSRSR